jgi:general secretion pathway protein K
MTAGAGRQRGFALLAVLWISVLLGLLAAGLLAETATETRLARNLVEGAKARALAEAGVALALQRLAGGEEAEALVPDGRAYPFAYGEGAIVVSVQDEGGKINLNQAAPDLLAALFLALGADEELARRLADAVVDWRDADAVRGPAGAEEADYLAAGLGWLPRNAPFQAIDELRLVIGMPAALAARAAPLVTVHSRSERVDPMTAPAAVLLALPGARPAEVEAWLVRRAALAEAPPAPTAPTAPARSPRAGRGRVAETPPFGEDYLRVSSRRDTFTIRAEARTAGGAGAALEALVRMQRGQEAPYRVLAWRRAGALAGE